MKRNTKIYFIVMLCVVLPNWFIFMFASRALYAAEYEKAGDILWAAFFVSSAITAIVLAAFVVHLVLLKKGYYISVEKQKLVIKEKETQLQELEEALRNSRIKNSVSQMQPHFLYNTLGSIREIVLDDPEYASELICDFTTHLRACIRAMSNDNAVPFSRELENIRAYVRIEQMRFGDKLRMQYDIRVENFDIIPLSVQPLVENAIRHGIYERGPAGGTVTLTTRELENEWYIQVRDDGVGFDTEAIREAVRRGERDSTGLENLTFRLEKMMNARVSIESRPGVGTNAEIYIPKGEAADASDHS